MRPGREVMNGTPLEPRILDILSDGEWHSRADISRGLVGKVTTLSSSTVMRLWQMEYDGKIKHKILFLGARGTHQYRITPAGLEMLEKLKTETKGSV